MSILKRFWHKNWPESLPHDIAIPDSTIHQTLQETAQKYPDNPAYYFQGKTITFKEIDALSNQFAHALITLGIKKGDRVAFMLPNIPQSPLALFGILKAGAIVTPINPLFKQHELHHQLNSAGVKHLLALDLFHEVVEKGSRLDLKLVSIHSSFAPAAGGTALQNGSKYSNIAARCRSHILLVI